MSKYILVDGVGFQVDREILPTEVEISYQTWLRYRLPDPLAGKGITGDENKLLDHEAEQLSVKIGNEEVWKLPVGFVDPEADKHGPVVHVSVLHQFRTDAEKGEWSRNNPNPFIKWHGVHG